MMTPSEERYVHYVSSINDLNNAWRILHEIKIAGISSPLAGPAFQFALVEYAKPYRTSRGEIANYKVDEGCVPRGHMQLHQRLLASRDQIHAHSDLTVRDAMVRVAHLAGKPKASIVQNVITGLEEIRNIDAIVDLIELTLDCMYSEATRLEANLTATS